MTLEVRRTSFEQASPLPGGYRVAAYERGRRLVLERSPEALWSELGRRLLVLLVPLFLLGLLWTSSQKNPSIGLVLGPIFLGLVAVLVLGLGSVHRAVRQLQGRARLEVDSGRGLVRGTRAPGQGLWADYLAPLRSFPLERLEGVRLTIFRDSKRPRSAHARLAVVVDGVELEGPTATAPDPEWERTLELLLPLACELARLSRRPLRVRHDWSQTERELSGAELE